VSSVEGIPAAVVENQIKETLLQIGARVQEERLE
jgi:hypothetical protein